MGEATEGYVKWLDIPGNREAAKARAAACVANFTEAPGLAALYGMTLKRHTAEHYQLIRSKPTKIIWNLYPRSGKPTPRIYTDSRCRDSYLSLRGKDWTLFDVVKEAVRLTIEQNQPKAAAK